MSQAKANDDEITQQVIPPATHPPNTQNGPDIVEGYDQRFGILAAIAFFGAGAAFSAVFQDSGGHRTFRDILAWSATCFTLGTVLAGAGGTVSGVGQIIHGTVEHRWLQGFAMLSGVFIFSGIILLGVAMISLNASPTTLAAGAVLIGLSSIFVVVALCMARCMVRRRRSAPITAKGQQKETKAT
ncbi:hypothetical protein FRC04_004187 [Tulasnella sp. 424]|nr:hypothetical protein FRC04_004187 [Tulasnella sp. 424]